MEDEFVNEEAVEKIVSAKNGIFSWLLSAGVGLSILFVILAHFVTQAPFSFQPNTAVTIEEGLSAAGIATSLKEQGVVRSKDILYLTLVLQHDPSNIKAGEYLFTEPLSVFGVAEEIMRQTPQAELLTLTLPEGYTAKEFARIAKEVLPDFNVELFTREGTALEGYLFPETYFVPKEFTAQDVLALQAEAYEDHRAELASAIAEHPLSEYEILVLASIIEREANTEESMRGVSGVLQNRLSIDMPLQADASIEYVLDKPLNELTAADLKIDSPYNTYLNKGLPPTPIGNPGATSIRAVLNPIRSNNFFYITGNDGVFRFAETFAEHNQNIARYLQ